MYDYEIENKFFYNLTHQRASKIYAQCDIFLRTLKIKGDIENKIVQIYRVVHIAYPFLSF